MKVARCTSRQSKSNPIKLNFNWTQSNSIHGLSSIEFGNRTKSNSLKRKKKSIEPKRTFNFRTHDLCKTGVENPSPDLGSSSYLSPECSLRVFLKQSNSAEMASDALWIVSFKCIVKGYQECHLEFTYRGTTRGTKEFNQLLSVFGHRTHLNKI